MSNSIAIIESTTCGGDEHIELRIDLTAEDPQYHKTLIRINLQHLQPSLEWLKLINETHIKFPTKYIPSAIQNEIQRYNRIKNKMHASNIHFTRINHCWTVHADDAFYLYDELMGRAGSIAWAQSENSYKKFQLSYQMNANEKLFAKLKQQCVKCPHLFENMKTNLQRDSRHLLMAFERYDRNIAGPNTFNNQMQYTTDIHKQLTQIDDMLFDMKLYGFISEQSKKIADTKTQICAEFNLLIQSIRLKEQSLLAILDNKTDYLKRIFYDSEELKVKTAKYEVKCEETWAYYPAYIIDYDNLSHRYTVRYPDNWKPSEIVAADKVRLILNPTEYLHWKPRIGEKCETKCRAELGEPCGWWQCKIDAIMGNECLLHYVGWGEDSAESTPIDMLRPLNMSMSLNEVKNVRRLVLVVPKQLMDAWILPHHKTWIDDNSLIAYTLPPCFINCIYDKPKLNMIGREDIVVQKKKVVDDEIAKGNWLWLIGYLKCVNIMDKLHNDIAPVIHMYLPCVGLQKFSCF